MLTRIKMVLSGNDGASAVEYGLLVAGIAAVIVLTVLALGGTLDNIFGFVDAEVSKVPTPGVGG